MYQDVFVDLIKANKNKKIDCEYKSCITERKIRAGNFYLPPFNKDKKFIAIPCIIYKQSFYEFFLAKADLISHESIIDKLELTSYDVYYKGWLTIHGDIISSVNAYKWYYNIFAQTVQELTFKDLTENDIANISRVF
jgi:hypothetical protein